MAGIYQRGKTYYAVYYVGGKKHRKSLETDDLRIAKAKLRELETELDGGSDNPFPTRTPIPVVLESFIGYMHSRRDAKSVNRDLSPLRTMFGEVCPSLCIKNRKIVEKLEAKARAKGKPVVKIAPVEANCFEAITTKQLSDWFTKFVEMTSPAKKTLNRYREILQKLFVWAVTVDGRKFPAGKNPADSIDRWREGAPVVVYMTREEIDNQLSVLASDLKLQTMVATYIYAGLRREEGVQLLRRDVDLKAGLIHVRAKGGDDEWDPKTEENRSVPISRQLRPYLEAYCTEFPEKSYDDWFFPAPEGGLWDADNFSTRALAKANKAHGLKWNCKIYRHTFGSHLAMRDVSMYKISKLLGNSVAICERYYAALSPQSLADAVDFDPDATEQVMKGTPPQKEARPQLRLVINNG